MAETDGQEQPRPRALPSDAEAYHRTKAFTAATVPPSLLTQHSTKAGTWGLLSVHAGQVDYTLDGEDSPLATIAEGETLVVLPEEQHFVRLSDDAEFTVEFYKRAGAAAPADPHR